MLLEVSGNRDFEQENYQSEKHPSHTLIARVH